MDVAVRRVSIAESARHAAEIAATTLEHQPNPHPQGTLDFIEWRIAYQRYVDELISEEGSA